MQACCRATLASLPPPQAFARHINFPSYTERWAAMRRRMAVLLPGWAAEAEGGGGGLGQGPQQQQEGPSNQPPGVQQQWQPPQQQQQQLWQVQQQWQRQGQPQQWPRQPQQQGQQQWQGQPQHQWQGQGQQQPDGGGGSCAGRRPFVRDTWVRVFTEEHPNHSNGWTRKFIAASYKVDGGTRGVQACARGGRRAPWRHAPP